MLADVLQVVDESDSVVHARQRIRRNSVFQERHVNVQKRERKDGVDERNFGNEILNNAGAAWDESDKRKVNGFFPIRGVLLRDGVLDTDDHRRNNVDEV